MATILTVLSQLFGGCSRPEQKNAEIYSDLRNQIFRVDPKDFEFSPSSENPSVCAVLMETGYPEGVATVVALQDGSASIYLSGGGGTIGAGDHEAVAKGAKAVVNRSFAFLADCRPTKDFPLPHKSHTRFYLLTTNGILTSEIKTADLGESRHKLSPLFHQVHELIFQIRQTEEQGRTTNTKRN